MSRIRTNLITNRMANGAPTVSNGLVISGVTTVTTLDVDGHTNLDNVSVVGVTTFSTSSSVIGAIIKNTAHDSQLQILATHANKNSVIFFGDAADDDIGQIDYDHNDNSLSFTVNANETIKIDSSGYMGLNGITNPSSYDGWGRQLVLGSTTGHGGLTIVSGNDEGEYGHLLFADGTGGNPDQMGRVGYHHYDDHMYFATNNTERLRIASDGNVHINCPDNGTANAKLNIEDSTNNTTNTLKLINKPSGANGKARLEFYTETSAGQGASPYIMSVCGTDAFGSNSANDGGFEIHTKHGGSGTDATAMKVSNKGYVLQPQRPYFKAQKADGVRITGTGYVVFENSLFNNGSHYNNSDGKFTAPIDGLYWFSCKINAYDRLDFQLRKNGTRFEYGQYNTDNDQVGWWSNQLTSIVEMTAGQYVQVYVSSLDQNTDPGEWCTFMGYLLN